MGDGFAYVASGVVTCGSVWSCPVCAAKIRKRRTADIEFLAQWHAARGGELVMVTLTVRHTAEAELKRLVEGLCAAWRQFQQSTGWRALREDLDGTVRALEVTQGFVAGDGFDNGWHPHLHVLLLVKAGCSDHVMRWLEDKGAAVWADRVTKKLGAVHTPSLGAGFRAQTIDATGARYITKIAQEMTRADLKGKGARLPWDIIEALDDGETWAALRWGEYVAALKGKRAVQWSRGLRELCGLGVELTDEEAATEDEGGEVCEAIDHRTWNRELRNGRAVIRLERLERRALIRNTAGAVTEGDSPPGGNSERSAEAAA